eukprot:CAMPEP_0119341900 /NCGR_PEP_ID=MMETSP1333-20130426/103580_1 /TAXON_ID=418940 /ORGANISM="Scyphosphaera apsteinii, Strain RCC1455" /LENGTH=84 /DNA_ID=CAMNT_0007353997 /DNA_START=7 /DNA_END=261 /DNA_ORIENTATION=+
MAAPYRVPVPAEGVPHSWVQFDDGSIADLTADQFDARLPKSWWPADQARYRVGAKASIWAAVNKHREEANLTERRINAAREWWH